MTWSGTGKGEDFIAHEGSRLWSPRAQVGAMGKEEKGIQRRNRSNHFSLHNPFSECRSVPTVCPGPWWPWDPMSDVDPHRADVQVGRLGQADVQME